jgi:predicted negative regulator of RcsB-dependent stress response
MPLKIRAPKKKETLSEKITDQYDHLKERLFSPSRFLVLTIIMLVVVGASAAAFLFFTKRSEGKAWALESKAGKLLDEVYTPPSTPPDGNGVDQNKKEETEKLERAAGFYEEILKDYPRTDAAVIAQFQSGHVYFELEKYKLAEEKYLAFIKEQADEKEFLPIVQMKLAYLYQKTGDTPSALKYFHLIYDAKNGKEKEKGVNQDQAGFEIAQILEQTEKKSEAIAIYKKVSEDFTESPWGVEAKTRLTLMETPPAPEVLNLSDPAMPSSPAQVPAPAQDPAQATSSNRTN